MVVKVKMQLLQVADFGLAKLSNENYTHVSTRIMGTFGYICATIIIFIHKLQAQGSTSYLDSNKNKFL